MNAAIMPCRCGTKHVPEVVSLRYSAEQQAWQVRCLSCKMSSPTCDFQAAAIHAWNQIVQVYQTETLTPDFSLAERQRIEKISQLIDKFMSDMGFVIPVRGFLYQKLTVIEDAFNQIYLQHQRLEDLDNSLDDEELRDCEERVAELEAKIDSLKLKEE